MKTKDVVDTNKSFKFYAIRIVGTDYFKSSKNEVFSNYETAMGNGVFFNQRKNAEKAIREANRSLSHYSTYTIQDGNRLQTYYVNDQHPFLKKNPELLEFFRPIELEVVELDLSIA